MHLEKDIDFEKWIFWIFIVIQTVPRVTPRRHDRYIRLIHLRNRMVNAE